MRRLISNNEQPLDLTRECVIIDYEYESGISSHLCYQGSLSFLLLTKRRGDLRDCCEKCLSGAHELGLKAPTQSPTRNPISGCVHTITDSFSCRREKLSALVWKLIRYVTCHLRDKQPLRNHRSYVWTEALPGMILDVCAPENSPLQGGAESWTYWATI